MSAQQGNVLVIGNSGVGKSTLINAVLGEDVAVTGWGSEGTTKELKIHGDDNDPFRIIDSVGFEPSFFKERAAIGAVKKWSKQSAAEENNDSAINVIWFCVEGTSGKLFPKAIEDLSRATAMWKSIPVIVVITKSYSEVERERNIRIVQNAFAKQKRYSKNLRYVIPVVAQTYVISDGVYAPPFGISELIDATCELIPEGQLGAVADIAAFKLGRKRAMAHGLTAAATTGAAVVGLVPTSFADSLILTPMEIAEVNAIGSIYGIKNNDESKKFFNSIVEVGAVGIAAKTAVSVLNTFPNLAGAVVNAIVAGTIVACIGEGSVYAFEQVYLGKKSIADVDWVKNTMESKYGSQIIKVAQAVAKRMNDKTGNKSIPDLIKDVMKGK